MSVTQREAAGLFGTQEVTPGTQHVVGRVEDVPPGEGRAFVAGGVQVAVFRLRDGSLHATQAACPHAGGPLADGQTDTDVLVCPLHLYTFRWTDGSSPGGAAPLRVYPVHEDDGQLVVTV
jgi:nitrite reductase/ring-hydroxylating ferredoxin subunit